jgi:hypothetical protein
MGIRGWSRNHAACIGWGLPGEHHACTSPSLPHAGGGRCTRCYQLQKKAEGAGRDPFTSINDVEFPGEGSVNRRERLAPMAKENGRGTAVVDGDVERSLQRFAAPMAELQAPSAPPADGAPQFEVFTIVGQVKETGPTLTLRADGRVSMNRAALELLGRPALVELLYDKGRAILGIRASSATVPHARILLGEKSAPDRRYVGARALLRFYGIVGARVKPGTTKQYGDVLAVELVMPAAKGR